MTDDKSKTYLYEPKNKKIYYLAPSVCDEWKDTITKLIIMDYLTKIKFKV